ncbi:MAG TPA: YfiR family protein [Cellvibrio sp.]|nr:YfiR family protein [Cellvibrio sp.]
MAVGRVRLAGQLMLRWSFGLLLGVHCLVASAQASEAGLRVAFVYNFLKFIEWPDTGSEQFSLCVLNAQDETRQSLLQLDNKPYQHKRIHVVYIDKVADLDKQLGSCQLLYIPASGAAMPLPKSVPAGTLLVMDEPDPADTRIGIALMRTADNRIEFLINDPAIQQAGVKVSSQLLKLAKKRQVGGG